MIDINENLESLEIPHHIMTSHSFTSPEWTFAVDVWTNNQHPLLTCFKTSFCLILRIFIVWVSRSLITLVDPSSITVVIIQAYTSAVWTFSPPQPSVCNVSDDLPSCHLTCSQSTNGFSEYEAVFQWTLSVIIFAVLMVTILAWLSYCNELLNYVP